MFLPVHKILAVSMEKALGRSGVTVELGEAGLGTGLGLGFSKGSLIGLKARDVRVRTSQLSVLCQSLTIAPRIWPLLLGQLQAGFECNLGKLGLVSGRADISTPWAPSTLHLALDAESVDLRLLDGVVKSGSFGGKLTGKLKIEEWALGSRGLPPVSWDLRGSEVATPAVAADLLNLPPLRLGPLNTKGSLTAGRLKIDALDFGSQDSPLQASWKINFGLDARNLPNSGEWTGTLRADPDFEKTALSDIKLSPLFGEAKRDGVREFKKVVRGNFASLIFNPPEN
jgi:hypothetical protein